MSEQPLIIIGAGPAGLTAAHEAVRQGMSPLVLERTGRVGGLARTELYRGYSFDIGGHRFFTKIPKIQHLWEEMIGDDFLKVPRKSSISYRGHFFNYPPDFFDVFSKLGIVECALIALSYLKSQIRPHSHPVTFEEWVSNHFGYRFYRTFFQKYTEKVWGIPCNRLRADWAAQRIRGLSLASVVSKIFFGGNNAKSMIGEFSYPRRGAGEMWDRFQEAVTAGGGRVEFNAEVIRVKVEGGKITGLTTRGEGEPIEHPVGSLISSIPVNLLVGILDVDVPDNVRQAARKLSYRSHMTVGLIIDREDLFPDQWIYVHDPDVRVARIQNYKNWSADMVPDPGTSGIGMEYFANVGDELWNMSDADMIDLASRDLAALKLAGDNDVADGFVIRQAEAYPVYDFGYEENVAAVRDYLKTIENLQTIGRNGLYRYNNMDHSMYTGLLAMQNLLGAHHDLWDVNEEREYLEEYSDT